MRAMNKPKTNGYARAGNAAVDIPEEAANRYVRVESISRIAVAECTQEANCIVTLTPTMVGRQRVSWALSTGGTYCNRAKIGAGT